MNSTHSVFPDAFLNLPGPKTSCSAIFNRYDIPFGLASADMTKPTYRSFTRRFRTIITLEVRGTTIFGCLGARYGCNPSGKWPKLQWIQDAVASQSPHKSTHAGGDGWGTPNSRANVHAPHRLLEHDDNLHLRLDDFAGRVHGELTRKHDG